MTNKLGLGGILLFSMLLAASDGFCRTLSIVTTDWPPFEYAQGKKTLGTDIAIVEEAFKRAGVPITISVLPWARSLKNVQTGVADAILTLRKTKDREVFLLFPDEPISVSENVFFRRKDSKFKYQTDADLNGRLVGAVISYDYGRDFATTDLFKRDTQRSDEKGFDMLAASRLDFMICDKVVGRFVLSKSPHSEKIVYDPAVYSRFDMYLAFAKKQDLTDVAKKFTESLRAMKKDGTYEKVIAKASAEAGFK
jgi:polar amino acid transport system substrate-binding protein